MKWLSQDFSFALRQIRKAPTFAIAVIVTLGIGIGAATAIFSLVDAVLLRPLPYAEPERVVSVDTMIRGNTVAGEHFASWPDFYDLRRGTRTLSAIAAHESTNMTVGTPGAALRRVTGTTVSAGMTAVLGVRLQLGRDFTQTDELAGNRSVILSDALWESELNRDPQAIGRTVQLDSKTFTVTGVLPRGFVFPGEDDSQFWITEAMQAEGKNPETQSRGDHSLDIAGRLAPGITRANAAAELTRLQLQLNKQYPNTDAQNDRIDLVPLAESLTGDVRSPLQILLAAVCSLLLIACTNVAGLMLTRAVARQAELAVRAALGASRLMLLRQLALEALTLALLAGLFGTGIAALVIRMAPRFIPPSLPHAATLSLDVRVMLFTLVISVGSGVILACCLRGAHRGRTPRVFCAQGAATPQDAGGIVCTALWWLQKRR